LQAPFLEFRYTPRTALVPPQSTPKAIRVWEDDADALMKVEGAKPLGRAAMRIEGSADEETVISRLRFSAAKRGGTHYYAAWVGNETKTTTEVDGLASGMSAWAAAMRNSNLDSQCQSGNVRACLKPDAQGRVVTKTTTTVEQVWVMWVFYVPSEKWSELPKPFQPAPLPTASAAAETP
jgi:hypothetical protein